MNESDRSTVQGSFRIFEDQQELLEKISRENDVPKSWIVRAALDEHLGEDYTVDAG